MKIRTFFKILFCFGMLLTLVLYLFHLYGNYIEKTQKPVAYYTLEGYREKISYKRSNVILVNYKSKKYELHTGDRILNKIKC